VVVAGGAYVLVDGMRYLDRKKTTLRVYLWMRMRFMSRMVRRGAGIGVQRCPRRPVSLETSMMASEAVRRVRRGVLSGGAYLIRSVVVPLPELFDVFCSTPSPVCVTEAVTVRP
jgi:hypothetical protein